jgi:hypothetical protein
MKSRKKWAKHAITETSVVLPGPRRTTEARRRRMRIVWFVTVIVIVAVGWLGYRELAGSIDRTVEFSGP